MRDNYDFSNSKLSPYAQMLKKTITIQVGTDVLDFFQNMAKEYNMPYENLINLYLKDCACNQRKFKIK